MYQRQGKSAYKANLDNTIQLDNYLGNPHKDFPTIHVAGTNGKGSTCHMIASVLQDAGYKVGLYTSPHLKDFRERIKVNGKPCEKGFVIDFVKSHREFLDKNRLSFFEMTVGMAFQYFKDEKVDIAVIETGLGGRLDSTNIITPLVCGITNIDKDHTALLGNTLLKIAGEKAGIIKDNVPVVVGEKRSHLRSRFRESAILKNAPISFINPQKKTYATDLLGSYQTQNVQLAAEILKILHKQTEFVVQENHLVKGFKNVVKNTNLRGRYEIVNHQPKIICDTAHNPAGLTTVFNQIKEEKYQKLYIVLGVVNDKKLDKILKLFPKEAIYFISTPDIPRGLTVDELASQLEKHNLLFKKFNSIPLAYQSAREETSSEDLILVTGSTFVVAEII